VPLFKYVKRTAGGKTLELTVELEEGVLKKLVISGDFFAYPPERIDELEREAEGLTVREAIELVRRARNSLTIVGADLDDITEILERLEKECS